MQIKTVDSHTLKSWLDNNKAVIVDVREPSEYQEANINSVTLIPLGIVSTNLLPPKPDGKKLVMQCRLQLLLRWLPTRRKCRKILTLTGLKSMF